MMTTLTPTDVLLERLHLIPDELCVLNQWLVWRDEAGRKLPYQAGRPRRLAKVNDVATWATFQEAVQTFSDWLDHVDRFTGIGYVLSGEDGYVGVDLDDCVTSDRIHPAAMKLIRGLNGYAEISPSGTGVKVWTRGALNLASTGTKWLGPWGGEIEIYHTRRWFACTGWRIDK